MAKMTKRIICYIRAVRNRVHKDVGRSLGLQGMAHEDQLHEEMETSDGVWNLWDCAKRDRETCIALVLDFLQEGRDVHLYIQEDDGKPILYETDAIRLARENIGKKPDKKEEKEQSKSSALKDAQKRLKELKAKRKLKFQGVH